MQCRQFRLSRRELTPPHKSFAVFACVLNIDGSSAKDGNASRQLQTSARCSVYHKLLQTENEAGIRSYGNAYFPSMWWFFTRGNGNSFNCSVATWLAIRLDSKDMALHYNCWYSINTLEGFVRSLCCTFAKSSKQLGFGEKSFWCSSWEYFRMHARWCMQETTFFAEIFKIQVGPKPSPAILSDAHVW